MEKVPDQTRITVRKRVCLVVQESLPRLNTFSERMSKRSVVTLVIACVALLQPTLIIGSRRDDHTPALIVDAGDNRFNPTQRRVNGHFASGHSTDQASSIKSSTELGFPRPFFYNHQSLPSGFVYRRRGTSSSTANSMQEQNPNRWSGFSQSSPSGTFHSAISSSTSRRSDSPNGNSRYRPLSPSLGGGRPPSSGAQQLLSSNSFVGGGSSYGSGGGSSFLHMHYEQPSFDPATPRNVTGQLGQTVYLHCVVRNLGDKTVSWIRRHDFHVLTVGLATYTTDDRFQAVQNEASQDWMLQIRLTQLADAGSYECQVNSHPLISLFVNLTVLVPKAHIRGGPDLYVKTGSAINLTCVIRDSPEPPVFIFWYHDERMINYDSSRGDISIQKAGDETTLSRLFIPKVQPGDSGNYTCGPSNAEPTKISVHVLNGEKPAAMQHDVSPSKANPRVSLSKLCWQFSTLLHIVFLWLSTDGVFRS